MRSIFFTCLLLILNNSYNYCQTINKDNDTLFNKAQELVKLEESEKALEIALNQVDELKINNSNKAKWLVFIGNIFRGHNELNKALSYYKQAHNINKQINDSLALMQDHIKIGSIYHIRFNEFSEKELTTAKALAIKDTALFYYEKNITNFKSIKKGSDHISNSHNNMAYIFSDIRKLDKAQYHITKAIEGYQSNNQAIKLDRALNNQGLIYSYQKKFKKAEEVYFKVLNSVRDTNNIDVLINREIATGNLAYIYTEIKDFKKANEYFKKKYEILELIQEKEKAAEITAIEAKYNQDKARQEEAEKTQREIERRERMQLWFGISGLVAVSAFLFGLVLYRNSKLKQKSLTLSLVKQELEQQRALKLLQQQNQNKVINATLDGREKERKDIAQTLHDSVSALLSSANLHLQVIKKKSPDGITEIEKSQRIINEASDKVRDLSHKLISAVLLKFGLEHAVYDMCEKYSNEDLTFELESEDKIPRFNQAFEIKLHNIIEEFINNIIKHSKASDAIIKLDLSDNNLLNIAISDNGIGFDTSKIEQKSNGIGLSQIIARIESLNGSLDIDSAPNEGTKINIMIPVIY